MSASVPKSVSKLIARERTSTGLVNECIGQSQNLTWVTFKIGVNNRVCGPNWWEFPLPIDCL